MRLRLKLAQDPAELAVLRLIYNESLNQETSVEEWAQIVGSVATSRIYAAVDADNQIVGVGTVCLKEGRWWAWGILTERVRSGEGSADLFTLLATMVPANECWVEVPAGRERLEDFFRGIGFIEFERGEVVVMFKTRSDIPPHRRRVLTAAAAAEGTLKPWMTDTRPNTGPRAKAAKEPAVRVHTAQTESPAAPDVAPRELPVLPTRRTGSSTIRRVVAATLNYDHPQHGQIQALRTVVPEVIEFDFLETQRRGASIDSINSMLVDLCVSTGADWLWMQAQDSEIIQPGAIDRIREANPRCVLTHWTGDLRPEISRYLSSICRATDLTLISSVGQAKTFLDAGARTVDYLQIGLDWDEDVLGIPEWIPPFEVPEVVFIGGYYGPAFPVGSDERLGAVLAIQEAGIDIGVVGPGWPTDVRRRCGECKVKQQHHVWKRAKVALSINHFNGVERYYSDRQLIALASGTPVVARYVPGIEHEFEHGKHCVFFRGKTDLVDLVRVLLNDAEMRKYIGDSGRAEVIRNHTWTARFLELLPKIERIAGEKS